jgi:hypothetical protein
MKPIVHLMRCRNWYDNKTFVRAMRNVGRKYREKIGKDTSRKYREKLQKDAWRKCRKKIQKDASRKCREKIQKDASRKCREKIRNDTHLPHSKNVQYIFEEMLILKEFLRVGKIRFKINMCGNIFFLYKTWM